MELTIIPAFSHERGGEKEIDERKRREDGTRVRGERKVAIERD